MRRLGLSLSAQNHLHLAGPSLVKMWGSKRAAWVTPVHLDAAMKSPRNRFEGLVSYTLGKAEDEAAGVLSPLQRQFSFGPADFDLRDRRLTLV